MAMTPQAAWEFTKQLSSLPGPGGAPSELEQAAQGKYADIGLAEYFPVAQIKENQQIGVKVQAAKDKMAAEQQAQEQGLPHPPQAPILEQLLAQERQRKGEPPMPKMQMSPMPGVPTPPLVDGGMSSQDPQGMLQQGMAYGGLVGLQAGGLFGQAQGSADMVTPISVDPASSNAVQEDEDDPGNLFGRIAFGAGSWEEAREHPLRTGAHTALNLAMLSGVGAPLVGGAKMLYGGVRALPALLGTRALGRGMASMAQKGPVRSGLARALTGRKFHPTGGYKDPKTGQFLGQSEIGWRALLRGGAGPALVGTAYPGVMPWNWGGDDDMTDAEREAAERVAGLDPGTDDTRGRGAGVVGMSAGERAEFTDARAELDKHEKWLRGETPEEEAERLFNATRAEAMEGRIDPERNSRERKGMLYDILAQGLLAAPDSAGPGSMGRAMSQYGGVGGIRSLMGLSREQEARDEALEDVAAEYRSRNLGAASKRTRGTVFPERMELWGAEKDYDLAMRQINAQLQSAAMQLEAARTLSPSDLQTLKELAFEMVMTDPNFSKLNQEDQDRAIVAQMNQLLGSR